jgi:DNA gyrase/topoisomerase IV subunit B
MKPYPGYDGVPITVSTAMESIRKRPRMYLGAERDDPRLPGQALWVAVRDALVETPVDPTLTVSVVVESDLVFGIQDDGVGLRVDPLHPGRPPWVTEILTELVAGQGPAEHGDRLRADALTCR